MEGGHLFRLAQVCQSGARNLCIVFHEVAISCLSEEGADFGAVLWHLPILDNLDIPWYWSNSFCTDHMFKNLYALLKDLTFAVLKFESSLLVGHQDLIHSFKMSCQIFLNG
jgi:hypothetical protein